MAPLQAVSPLGTEQALLRLRDTPKSNDDVAFAFSVLSSNHSKAFHVPRGDSACRGAGPGECTPSVGDRQVSRLGVPFSMAPLLSRQRPSWGGGGSLMGLQHCQKLSSRQGLASFPLPASYQVAPYIGGASTPGHHQQTACSSSQVFSKVFLLGCTKNASFFRLPEVYTCPAMQIPSEQAEAVDHAQQASQMLPSVVQLPKMAGKALQTISIMKEDTSNYCSEPCQSLMCSWLTNQACVQCRAARQEGSALCRCVGAATQAYGRRRTT